MPDDEKKKGFTGLRCSIETRDQVHEFQKFYMMRFGEAISVDRILKEALPILRHQIETQGGIGG